MGKADKNSDKRKDVNKKADRENKQQANSGSSNLESVSSSYNNLSENAQSKVNKKADRDVETSLGSDDHANNRVSVGNRKKIMTKFQTKEVGTSRGGGSLADESSEEDPEEDPEEEPEEDPEDDPEEDPEEDPQEENHADDSDDSDVVEQDVKVCDICGDAGREDNLCICSRCPDGAEHIYCSKVTLDKVPEGDWLCEECLDEENKNRNRRKYSTETGAEKAQSAEKDLPVVKVSGKRRAEESDSSSSGKQQAREKIIGSTKDVDRGKAKPSHQFASDSRFGNELLEGARSPPTRPRSESLRGNFVKSNSFNFSNGRSKTKLVDDLVLQRQKSTKERTSHEAREMGKSSSFRSNTLGFRSNNLGRFGESGSKVKMLSPNSSHVQDLGSLKNKKERNFERSNSVKTPSSNLGAPSSTALTPKGDKLTVSSASNSEAKSLKGESRMLSGTKSNSRSTNIGTEVPVSADPVSKQLSPSPTRPGIASSSGNNKSSEQRSLALKEDSLSRLATYNKESTNPPADVIKETTTTSQIGPGHSAQVQPTDKPGSVGSTASGLKSLQEINNGDNKLKDAIKEALRKKPGIYRKNKVFDQPDEVSVVPTKNNEVIPHSRNAVNLTSAEVSKDLQRQFSQSTTIDHSKQSNGNSSKPPMIFPAEAKHLTAGSSTYDDMALSSLPKISAIPDHECIWQGGFEISRSGKAAEFWDGLQAHLSTCASPRVLDSVNKLPHKIQLNGVSRISAWPTQFESSGVKETNIALYFFAKDLESYERSYQVLLDEMIRGDLALIGSFNGIELLIFPSNQLPERSNRWNMLFFLWGVFRGKKKNSLRQVPDCSEKNGIPKVVSSMPTDKASSAEDACLGGPIAKDKRVPFEPKGILKLPQNSKLEKAIEKMASPLDSVNVAPVANKEIISSVPITDGNTSDPNKSDSQDVIKQSSFVKQVPVEELNRMQSEPKKRHFIDLSEDDDITTTDQINVWHDASSRIAEEGSMNKIQKSDFQEQNSHSEKTGAGDINGKRYIFPLDLNEDIPLAGETDDIIMKEKGEDDGTASLSLSLAYSPAKIEEDGRMKGNRHSTPFNAYL